MKYGENKIIKVSVALTTVLNIFIPQKYIYPFRKGNDKENKLLLIHNEAAKLENKKIKIMEVKVMNQEEKKELMGKYAKKLENAIKREGAVIKEMENDKALIKYLEGQKTSGAAFDNTVYESYDAWIETIKKQIKKSENTLKNIEFKKVELEAVQKYIA